MMNIKRRHGFSLVEIVVSTAIIAFLMTSLFNYVSMAGTVWQKTHESITLSNEGNVLLDTIEKELWESAIVLAPAVGTATSVLSYSRRVSDYEDDPSFIRLNFEVAYDATTNTVSKALIETSAAIVEQGWEEASIADASPTGPKKIVRGHHTYALARSVKEFQVKREGYRLIEIDVLLGITDSAGNEKEARMKRTVLIR